MDLITKKNYLSLHLSTITNIFNRFYMKNNYMAVYFSAISGRVYLTFKAENTQFNSIVKLGSTVYILAFIYTTSDDFIIQTNSFMNS
jgi:hypothetical protein